MFFCNKLLKACWRALFKIQFVNFGAGQQKTAQSVIVEIGCLVEAYRLTIFGFLTRSLYIAKKTTGMNCFFEGFPAFDNGRQVGSGR